MDSNDVEVHRSIPASPNLRAHVERFIQTFKQECLDHFMVVSPKHLEHISHEFQAWYNRERPHSAVGSLPPEEGVEIEKRDGAVICDTRLGGTLRSYRRAG